MSIDIYSPCPCGSGKKIKFCCHAIADEMERISRLIEGNQPHVAVQQLEFLDRKMPKNPWVTTTRAMVLLDIDEVGSARDVLKQLLDSQPDNELAIGLYAMALVRAEGYEVAKRAIHRAFQKSAKKYPGLVSDLARIMAAIHLRFGQTMAAREHLALALRLASEDARQELFIQLLELDGEDRIAYPLRGSHQLPSIMDLSPEDQQEIRKAQKYAAVGCWSIAADVYTSLANSIAPDRAEFWHAIGLCRAWDGDEKRAAEALHRAARNYESMGTAVECETIAQILDDLTTQDTIDECLYEAKISSVSRLLTVLDAQPRFKRAARNSEEDQEGPVAGYLILNSDSVPTEYAEIPLESIPVIIGRVDIYDVDEKADLPANLALIGARGAAIDESKSLLTSAAEDLIEWTSNGAEPQVIGKSSADSAIFDVNMFVSPKSPLIVRRKLLDRFWNTIINEKWPVRPLRALNGQTPEQAVNDPSLRVPLLGAIYALDAASQRRSRGNVLTAAMNRLKVSPLPPVEVSGETNVGGLSMMMMSRLPIDQLNDQQLMTVVNRSMLIRHSETLHRILSAAVARPDVAVQLDLTRVYRTLAELSFAIGDRNEGFRWIDEGRKLPVGEGKSAFQHAWIWDLAELMSRLEDPSDAQLKPLLQRFVNYYGTKVPQIRTQIEKSLAALDIPSPWDAIEVINPASGVSSGNVWSPGLPEPVSAGGKLWLPGQ